MPPAEAPEVPPGFQLVDRRGLVADVRPEAPVGVSGPLVEPVGDGFAYLVSWTGGVCDEATVLTVTRSGADVELSLDVSLAVLAPGDACPSVGILRTIRLTFTLPIPPDRISIRQPDPRLEPRRGGSFDRGIVGVAGDSAVPLVLGYQDRILIRNPNAIR